MASYRPLRIAPDLPNSDPQFDDDTPPASPYQNRIPVSRRPKPPSLRVGPFFTITLPSPQTIIAVGLILLSLGWLFTPRQYKPVLRNPKHEPSMRYKNVDWRKYAYATFATDVQHVCSALMLFDQLQTYGSKAERILLYPQDWEAVQAHKPGHVQDMLDWAKQFYSVKLMPVHIKGAQIEVDEDPRSGQHRYEVPNSGMKLDPSITKFQALQLTRYLRVIYLDPHVSLLQHIDELFLGPDSRLAATRRYLSKGKRNQLSAHFFMTNPRDEDYAFLEDLIKKSERSDDYFDSQVLTEQFGEQAMILSHRRYGLNSKEFRRTDHYDFMGNEWEEWNPERVMRQASMIVFDEDQIPKPWITLPQGIPDSLLPPCDYGPDSDKDIDCRSRNIWTGLYNDYGRRRKDVCAMAPLSSQIWQNVDND